MCAHVCMGVCACNYKKVRAMERENERERERERERE